MSEWALKRFWKTVAVEEGDEGFSGRLDARPVRTPWARPGASNFGKAGRTRPRT